MNQGAVHTARIPKMARLLRRAKTAFRLVLGLRQLHHERDRCLAERDRYLSERDRYLAERDRYLAERDQLERERDEERERRMPDGTSAALHAALTERNAYLEQRDQAYREIDELCQERNRLKGVINRLGREFILEMVEIGGSDEMRAAIERECRELARKKLPPTEPNSQSSKSTSPAGNT